MSCVVTLASSESDFRFQAGTADQIRRICKDSSRKFCPSCGNPSLLRTTVTVDSKTGQQKIHLKKNFQYHLRGTKYTIPDAKPGRAKGQLKGGTGLVLREDQAEWQDAVRSQRIKKHKEEKKAANGVLNGWDDPDVSARLTTHNTCLGTCAVA